MRSQLSIHSTQRLQKLLTYGLLIGLSLLFVAPFLWLLSTSLKPNAQILSYPPVWIPHPVQWQNFRDGLTEIPFLLYLGNTLLICAANVIGTTLSSSMVAYGLSRIPWRGRELLFTLIVGTMLLPPQVTMVPIFSIFKSLGWLDTYLPLTFPSFLGGAFNVFMLRQFFRKSWGERRELPGVAQKSFNQLWRERKGIK